jgi:hypothetical protein
MHRRQARTIAEVREDDTASCGFCSGYASQFTHEKYIGQPVKAIPPTQKLTGREAAQAAAWY